VLLRQLINEHGTATTVILVLALDALFAWLVVAKIQNR
jgi:hypothetical protein